MKMSLWHFIFLMFFIIYNTKTGKIRPNFGEIFGNGWDKNEREERFTKIEQNKENEQIETIHFDDQLEEENKNGPTDQQKREIIHKFELIKEKLREKGKFKRKNRIKIECKIGKLLGANRRKIFKWKKELNLNKRMKTIFYEDKKQEFIERIDEFKNLYGQGKQKEFVKELGISEKTFCKWKKELMPKYNKTTNNYSNEDKLKKMKQYFEIKKGNSKINDEIIAKKLRIGSRTLIRWKKKFASVSEK